MKVNIMHHEKNEITGAIKMMEEDRLQNTFKNKTIMKSVLFAAVGVLIGGFVWLGLILLVYHLYYV